MTSFNKDFKIPDINLKNNLSSHFVKENIINEISNKVKEIPNYILLKHEIELLKFICCIIENMILYNNKKIDKKEIVTKIFVNLFSLSPIEVEQLHKFIDFLHNNKLIKRMSIKKQTKIFVNKVTNYFLKTLN